MSRRVGIGLLLVAGALAMGPKAGAETPSKQGWWTATGVLGLPAGVVGPDVPADGLLVEGGPDTPRTYAAIAASLPVDSALVLDVAPNSVTTADAALQVCALSSTSFEPAQGGSLDDAPEYDCDRTTTVTPSVGRYRLDVATFATDGVVAVALLPMGPTDRIVLMEPAVEAGFATSEPAEEVAPLSTFDPTSSAPLPSPVSGSAPLVTPPAPAPEAEVEATPRPAPVANLVPVGASLPEDADPVVVAITLLVGSAGAALWFGARQAAKAAVASGP
jgi:hypothetical protein